MNARTMRRRAAGTRAVPLSPTTALRTVDGRERLAAVVADLPKLDGSKASVICGLVPVAAIRAAVVSEVVQFQHRGPAAGAGVAGEGHVTNGGPNRYACQGSANRSSTP